MQLFKTPINLILHCRSHLKTSQQEIYPSSHNTILSTILMFSWYQMKLFNLTSMFLIQALNFIRSSNNIILTHQIECWLVNLIHTINRFNLQQIHSCFLLDCLHYQRQEQINTTTRNFTLFLYNIMNHFSEVTERRI